LRYFFKLKVSTHPTLKGEFTEDQHKRLLKVAENCPIHKLLTSNITIQTELNI
ncbi:TPA: hypothetical protein ACIFCR_004178, partial [Acinetobacter baumannii]